MFIKAANRLFSERDEILANTKVMMEMVCETDSLDRDLQDSITELNIISEQMQIAIAENSRVALDQDEYEKRNAELTARYEKAKAELREEQLVGGADENSEINAESDNETQVVPNISEDDNIVDNAGNTMKVTQHSVALETEKKVLEEMFELEKNHFGESKKAVKIDVSL